MKFTTNLTELLNVLNTCSKSVKNGFVPATSCFRFKLVSNDLNISACNLETATSKSLTVKSEGEDIDFNHVANETIKCTDFGDDIQIGLNGNYSIEAVNRFASEEILMYLSQPHKPVIFMEEESGDNMSLLAPLKVSETY